MRAEAVSSEEGSGQHGDSQVLPFSISVYRWSHDGGG